MLAAADSATYLTKTIGVDPRMSGKSITAHNNPQCAYLFSESINANTTSSDQKILDTLSIHSPCTDDHIQRSSVDKF